MAFSLTEGEKKLLLYALLPVAAAALVIRLFSLNADLSNRIGILREEISRLSSISEASGKLSQKLSDYELVEAVNSVCEGLGLKVTALKWKGYSQTSSKGVLANEITLSVSGAAENIADVPNRLAVLTSCAVKTLSEKFSSDGELGGTATAAATYVIMLYAAAG